MLGAILKAALEGVTTGLYPIGLVIVAALFTYAITVETGGIGVIRSGFSKISDDMRVMALLVVWGLGNFMEGMAGFGTAVAIPAAMLVGIGFDPVKAVLCCLVANTTPTAFGSVGVPTMVLASESGCEMGPLVFTIAKLQLAVTALGPFLVLFVADGWRGIRERWGMALLADVAFLLPWLAMAQVGCELPNIVGGLCVMGCFGGLGRLGCFGGLEKPTTSALPKPFKPSELIKAWMPFLCVIVVLAVGAALPKAYKVSPGMLILAAALAAGLALRLPLAKLLKMLGATVVKFRKSIVTICSILAVAKVLGALGVIQWIANGLIAVTGSAYPAFSPIVGALGSFITGSGTSANVLFGHLQASVAGDGTRALWYAAANVMGAGIGKMICPQSIVLGCAAAGLLKHERIIFRMALAYFVPVLLLACAVTFAFVKI